MPKKRAQEELLNDRNSQPTATIQADLSGDENPSAKRQHLTAQQGKLNSTTIVTDATAPTITAPAIALFDIFIDLIAGPYLLFNDVIKCSQVCKQWYTSMLLFDEHRLIPMRTKLQKVQNEYIPQNLKHGYSDHTHKYDINFNYETVVLTVDYDDKRYSEKVVTSAYADETALPPAHRYEKLLRDKVVLALGYVPSEFDLTGLITNEEWASKILRQEKPVSSDDENDDEILENDKVATHTSFAQPQSVWYYMYKHQYVYSLLAVNMMSTHLTKLIIFKKVLKNRKDAEEHYYRTLQHQHKTHKR